MINKIDELRVIVSDLNPTVICLTETWTDAIKHTNAFLKIDGYVIAARKDRTDTVSGCGGGLLIYVKEGIKCTQNEFDKLKDFNQYCSIPIPVISRGSNSLDLVLVYKPHKLYDGNRTDSNNALLNEFMRSVPKPSIVLGDFNFRDIDWATGQAGGPSSRAFLDATQDAFLTQHVDFPTQRSGSVIDLVFSSNSNLISNVCDVGKLGKSDHAMILIDICGKVKDNSTDQEVPDWAKADFAKMDQIIRDTDWDTLLQGDTVTGWNTFKSVLTEAQAQCVPSKKRCSPRKPLWMNSVCFRGLSERNADSGGLTQRPEIIRTF